MIKTLKCAAATMLLAFGVSSASALEHTYLNWHGAHLIQGGDAAEGSFDVTPDYDPNSQSLLSAHVTFWFTDDNLLQDLYFNTRWGTIWLGDAQEEAEVVVDGVVFDTATVDLLSVISGSVYSQLVDDGALSYSVSATQGDLNFLKAVLCIDVGERANVPDGGLTLALLGAGFLGMAALRRKA